MLSGAKPVIVIPAKLSSTRLPGKALLKETGKYLIQHVYERALEVRCASGILVATDSREIFEAVLGFGGNAVMTSPDHMCGTDRMAEAATNLDAEILINIQGDEPLFSPRAVEEAVEELEKDPRADMATLACRVKDAARFNDPNAVKVVADRHGFALYFSRSPIPSGSEAYLHHVGLYVFRREVLFRFTRIPPGPLERAERLEQLRALENGLKVKVVLSPTPSLDINTLEDYAAFVRLCRKGPCAKFTQEK